MTDALECAVGRLSREQPNTVHMKNESLHECTEDPTARKILWTAQVLNFIRKIWNKRNKKQDHLVQYKREIHHFTIFFKIPGERRHQETPRQANSKLAANSGAYLKGK